MLEKLKKRSFKKKWNSWEKRIRVKINMKKKEINNKILPDMNMHHQNFMWLHEIRKGRAYLYACHHFCKARQTHIDLKIKVSLKDVIKINQ